MNSALGAFKVYQKRATIAQVSRIKAKIEFAIK